MERLEAETAAALEAEIEQQSLSDSEMNEWLEFSRQLEADSQLVVRQ